MPQAAQTVQGLAALGLAAIATATGMMAVVSLVMARVPALLALAHGAH
jgi:hypothetical protein